MKIYRIKEIFADAVCILMRKRQSLPKKLVLLFYFIKITIQNFLNDRVKTYTHARFLGYTISFSSFSEFSILVREIFVEDPYYFESTLDTPHIIDAGGNIGMSVLYFKWLYPNAIIDVFEPAPLACRVLRKNIEQNNLKGVTVHEKALSNERGSTTFYLREEITLAATMEERESHGSVACTVETAKLSDYIQKRVDFMKIDIQFSEQRVFEDLTKAGSFKYVQQLVMEFHHHYGYESNSFGKTLQYLEEGGLHYFVELNCKKSEEFASYMITGKKLNQDN